MSRRGSVLAPTVDQLRESARAEVEDIIPSLYDTDTTHLALAASRLSKLASSGPVAIVTIATDDVLLNNLSRTIVEYGKSNSFFAEKALSIIFAISCYKELHRYLNHAKAGDACLTTIRYELKRHTTRVGEINSMVTQLKSSPDDTELQESLSPRVAEEMTLLEQYFGPQDHIFFYALHTLLNLSMEPELEKKLVQAKLVPILNSILARQLQSGLPNKPQSSASIVALTHLAKLSYYSEYAPGLADVQTAHRTLKIVEETHMALPIVLPALRLLLNLSLDAASRSSVVNSASANFCLEALNAVARADADIMKQQGSTITEIGEISAKLILSLGQDERISRLLISRAEQAVQPMFAAFDCPALANSAEARDTIARLINDVIHSDAGSQTFILSDYFGSIFNGVCKKDDASAQLLHSAGCASPELTLARICLTAQDFQKYQIVQKHENGFLQRIVKSGAQLSFKRIELLVKAVADSESPYFIVQMSQLLNIFAPILVSVSGGLVRSLITHRLMPRLLELIPTNESASDLTYEHLPAALSAAQLLAQLLTLDVEQASVGLGLRPPGSIIKRRRPASGSEEEEEMDSDDDSQPLPNEQHAAIDVACRAEGLLTIIVEDDVHSSLVATVVLNFILALTQVQDVRRIMFSDQSFANRVALCLLGVWDPVVRELASNILNMALCDRVCRETVARARFVIWNERWLNALTRLEYSDEDHQKLLLPQLQRGHPELQ